VFAQVPANLPQAAGLLGVSVPTIKRRLSQAGHTEGTLVGTL
jgi:hypothetical protein